MPSGFDIETVFNRFSEFIGSLVEFDRIDINFVNADENTITPLYGQARGVHVETLAELEFHVEDKLSRRVLFDVSGTISVPSEQTRARQACRS